MRAQWSADNTGRFTASELPGAVATPGRDDGGDDTVTTFRKAVHPDDQGRVLASLVTARDHRRRVTESVRVRCVDRRWHWAEWQVWPAGEGLAGAIVVGGVDVPRRITGLLGMAYN